MGPATLTLLPLALTLVPLSLLRAAGAWAARITAVQGWLEQEKRASKLIMQVHDELVLEVPDSELDLVRRELPRLMCGVAELAVPLLVEVGAGANWEKAH